MDTMRPHYTDAWDDDHAWPDRRIAARQHTMISHAQLRSLGVAPRTIAAACARGRVHRVHHGVYSLIPARARPRLAAERGALLACGPAALLSHATAAWLHGLSDRRPEAVELTVVAADRRRPAIRIHRVGELHSDERVRVGGLPVTSPARVCLDLAPRTHDRELAQLLDRALRKTSRSRLHATLARAAGQPGAARAAALLDPARPSADTWSRAERRLLDLIRAAGLPAPEANVALGPDGYVPDLLWRAERVIVEYDSGEYHSGPAAVRWDTARHNHLSALGYTVLHVTAEELTTRPERLLVQIAAALVRGRP